VHYGAEATRVNNESERDMRIFITGATGFIGGTLAIRLAGVHRVHGLTRNSDHADALAAAGIEPVVGDLDDVDLLTAQAQAADAVINAADSDHAGAVNTLIAALAGSGKPLLHTSGSSIVGEPSGGEPQDDVYTEADIDVDSGWTPAPDKQARVALDRHVMAAADRGIRSVVLCNTMIYGTGEGAHIDSVQIPRLVATARRTGIAQHIGRGLNVWSNVSLDDVCALYCLALERAPAGSFYFAENGEASFRSIAEAIASALHLAPPRSIDVDDAVTEWGFEPAVYALGSNSRVRAVAARRDLGWQPRDSSVTDWIHRDIRA
jgi:nucleoside-diphosphate-sugar epimerase